MGNYKWSIILVPFAAILLQLGLYVAVGRIDPSALPQGDAEDPINPQPPGTTEAVPQLGLAEQNCAGDRHLVPPSGPHWRGSQSPHS